MKGEKGMGETLSKKSEGLIAEIIAAANELNDDGKKYLINEICRVKYIYSMGYELTKKQSN